VTDAAAKDLPARASVVIVGGGVMGVSTAFHLAEAGVRDVLLLDRAPLGSGSTCKAAGGVRAQFSDELNIALGARSLEAFARFGERPGQEIDLHRVGYLWLLDDPADVATFEASVRLQNDMGVPSRMISVAEARALAPLVDADGLLAAAFSPTDGHCSPESVVLGYATAARRRGARIRTGCHVTGVEVRDGQVRAVLVGDRRVETEAVVCAAGAWSAAVGAMAGVDLPVTPLRRQIVFTEPVADLPPDLPMTIDYSSTYYFHREGPGLLLGMSDPEQEPGFLLDVSDAWLPRLGEAIGRRTPAVLDMGLTGAWAGLYEMSPDHNGLIGEDPAVSRFLYATGFSGHGFLMGPAVGEVLRDLYLGREPFVDVGPFSRDRFTRSGGRPEANLV
jgi:sarcosine oxidase subunit beta